MGLPVLGLSAEIDAGALQQQIDRQQTFKLPRQSLPSVPQSTPTQPSAGLKVWVSRFQLRGNTLLDEARLQSLLELDQGKEMSFADLETVVLRVAEEFRNDGWTIQAYLPEQDIQDGVVIIQVVQARLGQILIDGDMPAPATPEYLRSIIQSRQQQGDFLNGKWMDRALLIANDISGVYVSGNLKEGEQDAETDVVIKASQKSRWEGNASLDNTGSRGTGARRLSINLNLNNLVDRGDQTGVNLIETQGSRYARLSWTVPVGVDGWRVGANSSHLSYQVLQFQDTVAPTGTSDTRGLEASYPVIRSKSQNLYLNLSLDDKIFKNYSDGQIKSDYSSRLQTLGLYGNSFDDWGGGGSVTGSLNYVIGHLNLDGSPNASEIATTTQTAGEFHKIRYALSRQQVLSADWSLVGGISGQRALSGKNLDSSEKFYLGGSAGVRAYPSSEAGGSNGVMANLELRWQFKPNLVLAGFYDIGRVELYPSKNLQDVSALNQYSLKGTGVSLGWDSADGVALKIVVARRVGGNPAAHVETGYDLDGSLVKTRVWSSISVPF